MTIGDFTFPILMFAFFLLLCYGAIRNLWTRLFIGVLLAAIVATTTLYIVWELKQIDMTMPQIIEAQTEAEKKILYKRLMQYIGVEK
ncbi:MAG: hypothetical protein Ta2B_09520 [Termitinemataceae bacterium]|nr:MAG: hypothetical protein Ta2B_09520 [Termitinemataceae bacterium]